MFNTYSYSKGGHASANNNLKINAISGNLVKNHPLSIFVTATCKSTLFDPTNPRYNFPKIDPQVVTKTNYRSKWNGSEWEDQHYQATEMFDKEIPCTVLQAMIIGDGLFLCEIVKTSDFLDYFVSPNDESEKPCVDENEDE